MTCFELAYNTTNLFLVKDDVPARTVLNSTLYHTFYLSRKIGDIIGLQAHVPILDIVYSANGTLSGISSALGTRSESRTGADSY